MERHNASVLARTVILTMVALAVAARHAEAAERDAPPHPATLATFVGYWEGHTRVLRIDRRGRARERIDDGCCTRVIDYTFRLGRPRGTRTDASAPFRVTGVTFYNRHYRDVLSRPHVGESGVLHLRQRAVTDSLTRAMFCAPNVPRCGA